MNHIEQIEKVILLKESPNGSHKAEALSFALGIPVEVALVAAQEPNHLTHPLDLIGRKFNVLFGSWNRPSDLPDPTLLVSADLTSEWPNTPARKPPAEITLSDLPRYIANRFKSTNQQHSGTTLYEHAGLKFGLLKRDYTKPKTRADISTTRVTLPLAALQDHTLLSEYYDASGLGELHRFIPDTIDPLTFLAFLHTINKLNGANPKDLVVVSAGHHAHATNNPKYIAQRITFYGDMGRLNDQVLRHLDPFTIVALCESAVNMPGHLIYSLLKELHVTTH